MIKKIKEDKNETIIRHKEIIINKYIYNMFKYKIKKMRYIYYFLRENNKEFNEFAKTYDYPRLTEDERRRELILRHIFILFLNKRYEELSSIFHLFCKEVKGFKKFAENYLITHNELVLKSYCYQDICLYGYEIDEELNYPKSPF